MSLTAESCDYLPSHVTTERNEIETHTWRQFSWISILGPSKHYGWTFLAGGATFPAHRE